MLQALRQLETSNNGLSAGGHVDAAQSFGWQLEHASDPVPVQVLHVGSQVTHCRSAFAHVPSGQFAWHMPS